MTEQEEIKKHISECKRRIRTAKAFMKAHSNKDCEDSKETISRMETVIYFLEKHIPKKPIFEDGFIGVYKCPVCMMIVGNPFGKGVTYCPECGNAIKWKEGGLNG